MLRLQRVTFLALNQFLGLGHELIVQVTKSYIFNFYILFHLLLYSFHSESTSTNRSQYSQTKT